MWSVRPDLTFSKTLDYGNGAYNSGFIISIVAVNSYYCSCACNLVFLEEKFLIIILNKFVKLRFNNFMNFPYYIVSPLDITL
jgi:hypothetical protein